MCGIAGAVNDTRESVVAGMLGRIRHRGPDGKGFKIFNGLCMGNVRLSIIDIEGGGQPMAGPGGGQWIVYNGEIYGYKESREQLLREGYPFTTVSDTEVILALYRKYGLEAVSAMNGMFSFCLYDGETETVMIARDQFGIKPLVYTMVNDALYFSSEVKAFYAIPEWKPEPDMSAWHAFMNIRFPPAPATLFRGVKKVPPGCYIALYRKEMPGNRPAGHTQVGSLRIGDWRGGIYRYYSMPREQSGMDYAEAEKHLRTLLTRSVEQQLVADVDVGVYLSGGIDSSVLTACASGLRGSTLNSICLGFNEPSDENGDAAQVAQCYHTNHRDIYIDDAPLAHFKRAVYFMEEPKVNCLQGYLIAREARKFQKVMLSGLGGDELFGGYDIYEAALYLDTLRNPVVKQAVSLKASAVRFLLEYIPSLRFDNLRRGADILKRLSHPLDMYLMLRNCWDHDSRLREMVYKKDPVKSEGLRVRDSFIDSFPECASLADAFMHFERTNKMVDDFLSNEDRMSLAHGLEVRVPFLDRGVVEFAASLPLAYKLRFGERKRIVRSMMRDALPGAILRKKKHGFTFNPVCQFRKDLGQFAAEYLTRSRIRDSGVFNYAFVRRILDSKPNNAMRWHYFLLWEIIGYHIWEDIFIRGSGIEA